MLLAVCHGLATVGIETCCFLAGVARAVYVAHVDHARLNMQRAVLLLLQALRIKRSGLGAGVVILMPAAYADNAILSKIFAVRLFLPAFEGWVPRALVYFTRRHLLLG